MMLMFVPLEFLGSFIDWGGFRRSERFGCRNGIFHFFIPLDAKISVFFELRRLDIPGPAQNIDPQGLARKILWNKELASDFGHRNLRTGANSRKVPARIFPILLFAFFSVKVVRHKKQILGCGKEEGDTTEEGPKVCA
jgi:hypothetical protein